MKYTVIDNGLKINTLEYNTFELEGVESGEEILENQTVKISIKLGFNEQNNLKRAFLVDVFIEGKNEDVLLRNLHLDIFYEFEYPGEYTENEVEQLDSYMLGHYLNNTNDIVKKVSSIDQLSSLNINDAVDKATKKIPSTMSVTVSSN
ncbi:hypothetical protein ACTGW9_10840 [Streptococcus suis]